LRPEVLPEMSHPHHSSSQRPFEIASINRIQVLKRRSRRIALNAPVSLSGGDRQKCTFTMPARATNLNGHGAAIRLNRELVVGSSIMVRNARGSEASARVVTQVSAVQGVRTYGIEFLDEGGVRNFWGISFPPPSSETLRSVFDFRGSISRSASRLNHPGQATFRPGQRT
jgi:hypothetical protein